MQSCSFHSFATKERKDAIKLNCHSVAKGAGPDWLLALRNGFLALLVCRPLSCCRAYPNPMFHKAMVPMMIAVAAAMVPTRQRVFAVPLGSGTRTVKTYYPSAWVSARLVPCRLSCVSTGFGL